jgi:hypothetical protein
MNFKANKTAQVTKVQKKHVPTIFVDKRVLAIMHIYIDQCADEIGWLCAAKRTPDNDIHIYDVFLFEQEVHGATTEISPASLASFAEKLLMEPNGMELFNDIRAWGHSHVRMAVNPSGQDDLQMKKFGESGAEWFVRIIGNKLGDIRFDVYDYERGIEIHHCDWEVIEAQEILEVYEEIDRLYKLIDEANKNYSAQFVEDTKAEMTLKVKKMWANRNYKPYTPYVHTPGGHSTPGKHLEQVPPRSETSQGSVVNMESNSASGDVPGKTSTSQDTNTTNIGGGVTREVQYHAFFKHADFIDMAALPNVFQLDEFLFQQYDLNLSQPDLAHLYYYAKTYADQYLAEVNK